MSSQLDVMQWRNAADQSLISFESFSCSGLFHHAEARGMVIELKIDISINIDCSQCSMA
jgi:hypothetical protein